MIEEMYKEEFAGSPQDSDPSLASSSMGREGVTYQAEDWSSSKDHFSFCNQSY